MEFLKVTQPDHLTGASFHGNTSNKAAAAPQESWLCDEGRGTRDETHERAPQPGPSPPGFSRTGSARLSKTEVT